MVVGFQHLEHREQVPVALPGVDDVRALRWADVVDAEDAEDAPFQSLEVSMVLLGEDRPEEAVRLKVEAVVWASRWARSLDGRTEVKAALVNRAAAAAAEPACVGLRRTRVRHAVSHARHVAAAAAEACVVKQHQQPCVAMHGKLHGRCCGLGC